jgi:hypothetical protein
LEVGQGTKSPDKTIATTFSVSVGFVWKGVSRLREIEVFGFGAAKIWLRLFVQEQD